MWPTFSTPCIVTGWNVMTRGYNMLQMMYKIYCASIYSARLTTLLPDPPTIPAALQTRIYGGMLLGPKDAAPSSYKLQRTLSVSDVASLNFRGRICILSTTPGQVTWDVSSFTRQSGSLPRFIDSCSCMRKTSYLFLLKPNHLLTLPPDLGSIVFVWTPLFCLVLV